MVPLYCYYTNRTKTADHHTTLDRPKHSSFVVVCHNPFKRTDYSQSCLGNQKMSWNTKQKRAYHRAKSGVKVASILHIPIKHLVLTTSPQGATRNIANDFQILRKRVYRKFNVLLPYFMVHTNEGNGVLHVLYRSKQFLPQKWISNQWNDIHLSSYIYIKEPPNDVARYVVTQYVAGQGTSYQRCSWSHNWVCQGFVKQWKLILNQTRNFRKGTFDYRFNRWLYPVDIPRALSAWDEWLYNHAIKQITLPCND